MNLPALIPARPEDAAECIRIRALTRENAFTAAMLRERGITVESWGDGVRNGDLPGWIAWDDDRMAGYCFGDRGSGEILVLVVLPEHEGRGLGRRLLERTQDTLAGLGWQRLFLGCSSDPASRSYGFYRHLGWVYTGESDEFGDQILELRLAAGD